MDNPNNRVKELLKKYLAHKVNTAEREELFDYVNDPAYADEIQALLSEAFDNQSEISGIGENGRERVLNFIFNLEQPKETTKIRQLWPRIAAAAAIVIAIGFFYINKQPKPAQIAKLTHHDIAPGHNQATLTLSNGQQIILTKGMNGRLAQNIRVNVNGITYKQAEEATYNTLSTARGEQSPYPLILADGTKVWLNAASSITFPTAFNNKTREVKITGEAYFEVVHNSKQPFRVSAGGQTIEDMGTHFDINAYSDEAATRTTLIEGAVKVNGLLLQPNQQTDGQHIQTVNTDIVTAWKDGNFHFEGDHIATVMRQLARWYNIDVSYQGNPPSIGFYGDISRAKNISAVLKMMEKTNAVHFIIEGRRVTVID